MSSLKKLEDCVSDFLKNARKVSIVCLTSLGISCFLTSPLPGLALILSAIIVIPLLLLINEDEKSSLPPTLLSTAASVTSLTLLFAAVSSFALGLHPIAHGISYLIGVSAVASAVYLYKGGVFLPENVTASAPATSNVHKKDIFEIAVNTPLPDD